MRSFYYPERNLLIMYDLYFESLARTRTRNGFHSCPLPQRIHHRIPNHPNVPITNLSLLDPRTSTPSLLLFRNPLHPNRPTKTNKNKHNPKPTTAFKPRPTPSSASLTQGTKQYQLRKYAEQTLGSGNLRNAVVLPEGEEVCEWVAVHGESRSFLGGADCVAEAF